MSIFEVSQNVWWESYIFYYVAWDAFYASRDSTYNMWWIMVDNMIGMWNKTCDFNQRNNAICIKYFRNDEMYCSWNQSFDYCIYNINSILTILNSLVFPSSTLKVLFDFNLIG